MEITKLKAIVQIRCPKCGELIDGEEIIGQFLNVLKPPKKV